VPRPTVSLLQGSLDVIVLKTLAWQPMHGFALARRIRDVTDDVLQVEEGSLYPALYRMENRGWIRSEWRITANKRRAKYYALTAAGRRQLTQEMATWETFVGAVGKVFAAGPALPEGSAP
jgi:PadR family transcriptional regulator, regulatory protein PadR